MSNYKKLAELSDKLIEYAKIEGTEVGEYWNALCDVCRSTDCLGEEFQIALIKEIEDILLDIQNNYQVIESNHTKELEYLG